MPVLIVSFHSMASMARIAGGVCGRSVLYQDSLGEMARWMALDGYLAFGHENTWYLSVPVPPNSTMDYKTGGKRRNRHAGDVLEDEVPVARIVEVRVIFVAL
jgi:hypothetical protein